MQVRYSDSLVEELYMPVEQIKFDSEMPGLPDTTPEFDTSLACYEVIALALLHVLQSSGFPVLILS